MSAGDPQYTETSSNGDKTPSTEPKKEWTVMIYMAGDNNLSEECVYNLTEAKAALTEGYDKLAVLAQFDPAGLRAETHRYRLTPTTTPGHQRLIDDRTGWKAHETETGEPRNLLEFLRWGISECPADHYLVVLVGHGSGTNDDYLLRDDNPPGALSIDGLRWVFDQITGDGQTIDILGFDTCLMNMAEVAFELLRTNITYIVGSEGYSPNTGWPYRDILTKLSDQIHGKKSDHDVTQPQILAKDIAEQYRTFYVPYISGGVSVDQSVLNVKKIDEVKRRMFSLVEALMADLNEDKNDPYSKKNALVLAHWDAQSYNGESFVDLRDFCECLLARYDQYKIKSEVIEKCGYVIEAINDMVIRTCIAGSAFQFSYGLSIYFPWAVLSPSYRNLAFPKETGWLDYLMRYHLVTRRTSRDLSTVRLPQSPYRATPETNKGRDGRVESMRNPPIGEFIDRVGSVPKPTDPAKTPGERASEVKMYNGQGSKKQKISQSRAK
jgi:hypothetical protein